MFIFLNRLALLSVGVLFLFSSHLCFGYTEGNLDHLLKVRATAGPNEDLSDATVTVRNSAGVLVGQGRTNVNGITSIYVSPAGLTNFPLKITTSGGTINGERFPGHVKGQTSEVGAAIPSVKLDLLSTSASLIAGRELDYTRALLSVRASLGINEDASAAVLQLTNPIVEAGAFKQLEAEKGGFNGVAHAIARAAKAGTRFTGFDSVSASNSSKTSQLLVRAAAAPIASSSPICQVPIDKSHQAPTRSSKYWMVTTGIILINTLKETLAAGVGKGVANALPTALGIFLSTPKVDATAVQLTEIKEQLNCLSSQVHHLSQKVTKVQLTASMSNATACRDRVDIAWAQYEDVIRLGKKNSPEIEGTYLPAWDRLWSDCGAAINNALFTPPASGIPSGWNSYAATYTERKSHTGWLTQNDVQNLQDFLNYWGDIQAKLIVLAVERDSYFGYQNNTNLIMGYSSTDLNFCSRAGQNACTFVNNINSAYPPNLYSDEIGLIGNGRAVIGYPLRRDYTTKDLYWDWNMQVVSGPNADRYGWGMQLSIAVDKEFAATPLNTSKIDEAVSYYSKPRLRHWPTGDAFVSVLSASYVENGVNLNAKNLVEYFIHSANMDPASPWRGLGWKEVSFATRDSTSTIGLVRKSNGNYLKHNGQLVSSVLSGALLNDPAQGISADVYKPSGVLNTAVRGGGVDYVPSLVQSVKSHYGVLLYNDWWSGASTLAAFNPPLPPVKP